MYTFLLSETVRPFCLILQDFPISSWKKGYSPLTLCVLMSSAGIISKQVGSRTGPTKCRACSRSKLFDTLMVFLKEFFKKIDFEIKFSRRKKSMQNYPVNYILKFHILWRPCSFYSLPFNPMNHCFIKTLCMLRNFLPCFVVCRFFQN